MVNVPKRNIGQRRIAFLKEYSSEHNCTLYDGLNENIDNDIFQGTKAKSFIKLIENFTEEKNEKPVSEMVSAILDSSGYERMLRTEGSQERLDNLAELKQSIYEYETTYGEDCTLENYLNHITLFSNSDVVDKSDKVKLMTVHTAKGLEFPNVFLCGMNEGVFPSRKAKTQESIEEERRLAFVAVTRAEKRLFITESLGRNFDGSPRYPSRFILEIDQNLLEYIEKPEEGLIKEAKDYISLRKSFLVQDNAELIREGDRIRHKIFGEGVVTRIDNDNNSYAIKFDKIDTTRNISFRVKEEFLQKI